MAADGPPHHVSPAATLQRWEALSFLHWRYPVDAVRRCVPDALEVQTYEGHAWIGLVPFRMRAARPGFMAAPGPFARLGTFGEVNVRTYVEGPDGPGVWFLALEAASATFAALARTLAIPYNWARVSVLEQDGTVSYRTRRRPPHSAAAEAEVSVAVGELIPDAEIGDFENFLVSRWRAYHGAGGVLLSTRVEHPPWTLHQATWRGDAAPLLTATGLPEPEGEPLVHYSPGLDVRLAGPVSARSSGWARRVT